MTKFGKNIWDYERKEYVRSFKKKNPCVGCGYYCAGYDDLDKGGVITVVCCLMGVYGVIIMNDVKFYLRKEEYGWLSNFERTSQIVDGIIYPTNEHYYQSQKAKDRKVRKWIRKAPSAWLAMKAGRSLRPKEMVDNWDKIKTAIMIKGLRAKFSQNKTLKEKLLGTGNRKIHEDSPTDMFWGIKGKDMLGKLLENVRVWLRNNE